MRYFKVFPQEQPLLLVCGSRPKWGAWFLLSWHIFCRRSNARLWWHLHDSMATTWLAISELCWHSNCSYLLESQPAADVMIVFQWIVNEKYEWKLAVLIFPDVSNMPKWTGIKEEHTDKSPWPLRDRLWWMGQWTNVMDCMCFVFRGIYLYHRFWYYEVGQWTVTLW